VDSLTQIALGAAVGEAVLGRRVGRKAALWGAICGTLPDLDILIPFGDPVADFTFHRSFSHSVFILALLTPLLVWLIRKIHPADGGHRKGWYMLVYLAFLTHVLLDSCTIYGTQIFWPLSDYPMTWGSIFIIDPLYTLPLLVGVIVVAANRRNPASAHRFNLAMLALSTLYLGWSFAAKFHAQGIAVRELARQGIEHRQIVTVASPFNTVLWRYVVMTPEGYAEGWYSLLDKDRQIDFTFHDSATALLTGLESHWPVTRLQWFTKGFYQVTEEGGNVVITDLRMGGLNYHAFRFKVGTVRNPHSKPVPGVLLEATLEDGVLSELWRRLKGHGPTKG
jgi:inner membrane protein